VAAACTAGRACRQISGPRWPVATPAASSTEKRPDVSDSQAREHLPLSGSIHIVEDDGRRLGQPRSESCKGRRTAAALSRCVGGGPVDHEKIDLIVHLRQGRAGVPGRVALQRRVHDAREVDWRYAPQHVGDEAAYCASCSTATMVAPPPRCRSRRARTTVLTPLPRFDDPRSAPVHNLIAYEDQPGRAHRPGAPRQIVSVGE
jgi:hypothetical protein